MHLLAGNAFKPAWRWGSRRGSPPLPVAHVVARGGEQRPPRRPVAAREAQVARGLARAAPAPARPLEPAEPGQVERQPPGGDAVHPAEEVLEPGVQGVHAGERGVRLVARVVGEVLGVDAQRLLDAGVGPVRVGDQDRPVADPAREHLAHARLRRPPAAADLGEDVAERVLPGEHAHALAGDAAHGLAAVPVRRPRHLERAAARERLRDHGAVDLRLDPLAAAEGAEGRRHRLARPHAHEPRRGQARRAALRDDAQRRAVRHARRELLPLPRLELRPAHGPQRRGGEGAAAAPAEPPLAAAPVPAAADDDGAAAPRAAADLAVGGRRAVGRDHPPQLLGGLDPLVGGHAGQHMPYNVPHGPSDRRLFLAEPSYRRARTLSGGRPSPEWFKSVWLGYFVAD